MRSLIICGMLILSSSAFALEDGTYTSKHSPDDLITVIGSAISVEHTRQVGGPGGISNDGVVPYPTVCRTIEVGKITEIEQKYISYSVQQVALVDVEENTAHCKEYIEAYKNILSTQGLSFSLYRNELVSR